MNKAEWEMLLDSAVSEIEYSIKTKHTKSKEVREHYLRNAIRFIEEAKRGDEMNTEELIEALNEELNEYHPEFDYDERCGFERAIEMVKELLEMKEVAINDTIQCEES